MRKEALSLSSVGTAPPVPKKKISIIISHWKGTFPQSTILLRFAHIQRVVLWGTSLSSLSSELFINAADTIHYSQWYLLYSTNFHKIKEIVKRGQIFILDKREKGDCPLFFWLSPFSLSPFSYWQKMRSLNIIFLWAQYRLLLLRCRRWRRLWYRQIQKNFWDQNLSLVQNRKD
jgi:hypothetical protein